MCLAPVRSNPTIIGINRYNFNDVRRHFCSCYEVNDALLSAYPEIERSLVLCRLKIGRIAVIELSGALCLGITLILGALLLRARRQLRETLVACTVFDRAATIAQKSRQEAANLREMLDAVPMPVWRRGPDLALVDCNRAYADALDTTAELALAEGRELVSGAQPGERRHVVIGGSRRLFEIGEMTCGTGGAIGFAVDRTDLETAEAELWRHINAHAEVLEGIGTSIAIYGPDKRLRFFNTAFASMWGRRKIGSPQSPRSERF